MKTAIVVWSALLVGSANLFAQPAATPQMEPPYERKLFPLQHVFAPSLAADISKAFNDGKGPSITAVPIQSANSILISAPAPTLDDVAKLIAQLDRAAPVVGIDVWFIDLQPDAAKRGDGAAAKSGSVAAKSVELLKSGPRKEVLEKLSQLEREGRASVINHFHLKTLSNQPAFAQQGERKPKIVTTASTSKSGRTASSTYDNVGTMVQVQPRVNSENQIVISVDVEKSLSAIGPKSVVATQPEQVPEIREVQTPINIALLEQSTVTVKNGEILSLTSLTNSPGEAPSSYQVLISAEVLREGATK